MKARIAEQASRIRTAVRHAAVAKAKGLVAAARARATARGRETAKRIRDQAKMEAKAIRDRASDHASQILDVARAKRSAPTALSPTAPSLAPRPVALRVLPTPPPPSALTWRQPPLSPVRLKAPRRAGAPGGGLGGGVSPTARARLALDRHAAGADLPLRALAFATAPPLASKPPRSTLATTSSAAAAPNTSAVASPAPAAATPAAAPLASRLAVSASAVAPPSAGGSAAAAPAAD
eukprot:TRINITY_DN5973_c1_g1_i3.p2 TRINITY_DN5973_c1_g1~~TRINITY_DN5973_c1_g1_i3.p2  ORF type:complete len:236 (+),score=47.68 TRINITY_DN5973_c1_g1_i3:230-937(+)